MVCIYLCFVCKHCFTVEYGSDQNPLFWCCTNSELKMKRLQSLQLKTDPFWNPLLPGCKIHSSFTPHPESRMGNDANTNQQVAKLKLKLIITNFLLPFSNQSNWFSSLQHLSVQHMTIGYSCLFAKNSESGLWDSSF